MHFCYILANTENSTYNGYTNNLERRLRQHNSEITGGARATSGKGPWSYVAVITSFHPGFDYHKALSLEWHIRYPTNRRPRPRQYQGIKGRISSLPLSLSNPKFRGMEFLVFLNRDCIECMECIESMKSFEALVADKFLPIQIHDLNEIENVIEARVALTGGISSP